jgi:hypothetical protein
MKTRLFEQAQILALSASQTFPTDCPIQILYGIANYKCNSYHRYIEIFGTTMLLLEEGNPKRDEVIFYHAKSLFRLDFFSEAKRFVSDVVNSGLFRAQAVYLLGRIKLLEGDLIGAIRLFLDSERFTP